MLETKLCNKCNRELPLNNFYKNKDSKDGLRSRCKECEKVIYNADLELHKNQHEEYYKKNITKVKARTKSYYQNNKEKLLQCNREYRKQYEVINKEKIAKRNRAYAKTNDEKIKSYRKEYREKNKEKIAERNKFYVQQNLEKYRINSQKRRALNKNLLHTLTVEQWESIKKRFDNRCCYCGEELPLTQEHFIPLSKGGEYTQNNIIPACGKCNTSKKDRDFFMWYPKQDFYNKKREKKILEYLNYISEDIQQLALTL